MLIQGVLSVAGRGVWRVGAVLLGAGGGMRRANWGVGGCVLVGTRGGGCMCVVLYFLTSYVITIPDIVLPPSRLGLLLSVRGVEIYSGWVWIKALLWNLPS